MGLPIIKTRAKVIINLNIQYIWPVSRSVVVRLTRFRKTWMETKEGDQSPSVKDDCSCLEYMCIRPYVQQICNNVLQWEISRCAHTNLRTKWPFQLMLQNFHLSFVVPWSVQMTKMSRWHATFQNFPIAFAGEEKSTQSSRSSQIVSNSLLHNQMSVAQREPSPSF